MLLYSVFNALAVAVVTLYNLLQYKEKRKILGGISLSIMNSVQAKETQGNKKLLGNIAFWIVVETLIITAAQYYSAAFFEHFFWQYF